MNTTEYNEVSSLMCGEGRSLFDRLTITEIVSRETNLNLDSLISEMRDIPNIEVDTVEELLVYHEGVCQGEGTLSSRSCVTVTVCGGVL